jgi:hypothetical protein
VHSAEVAAPRSLAAALSVAALLGLPGVAIASVRSDAQRIKRGLSQAQRAQWVKPGDAFHYRYELGRATIDIGRLPPLRGAVIAAQLAEIAQQAGSYVSPRALALFSMLQFNLDYLEAHPLPKSRVDAADTLGVDYRWFGWQGFQVHPLADFGALNSAAVAGATPTLQALADALAARGVPRGNALRFEYYFWFSGARPPWTSGMAQAVAAQALARAGSVLGDETLLADAKRAYVAVPGLLLRLSAGPWIRLYSFDHEVVFNAQLQTILSLLEYADVTGDPAAASLAHRLDATAQALLPRFDTGYWTLYELGGQEAPLEYEQYVTDLAIKLAQQTGEPVWQSAAKRFYAYVKQPPQLTVPPPIAPITLYPQPADGWLDNAQVTFTLSKRARVTLSAGGRAVGGWLDHGQHALTWKPGTLPPGSYTGQLTAVDLAGNKTTVTLPQPFVLAQDQAPQVQAQLQGTTLSWQGVDPGTPRLSLKLGLTDPTGANPPQTLDLGWHSVSGTAIVTLPSGTWQATLTAANTSGLSTSVDLGQIVVS